MSAAAASSTARLFAACGRICRAAAPSPAMPSLRGFGTQLVASGGGAIKPDPFVDHVEIDHPVLFRIADDAHGVAALAHDLDLLLEQAPEYHDAAVAGAEVLLGAVGDRSLGFP